MPAWLQTPLAGIAQIYFQSSPIFGIVLLLCLYLAGPALALGAVLGVAVASVAAWLMGYPVEQRRSGAYGFNAALSGVGLCATYQLTPALVAWIAVVGMLAPWLTEAARRRGFPVLTSLFVATMWMAMAAPDVAGLTPAAPVLIACAAAPLSRMFCGVSQIAFIDAAPLGMLLWAMLARRDWHTAMWALGGAAMTFAALKLVPGLWPQAGVVAQAGCMGVNCVLVMLGLSVFGTAWQSRLAGGALSIVLCIAFGKLGVAYFTLPFVLATWLFLYLHFLPRGAGGPAQAPEPT